MDIFRRRETAALVRQVRQQAALTLFAATEAQKARADAAEARRHLALVMEGIGSAPMSVYPSHAAAVKIVESRETVRLQAPHVFWPPLQRALVDAETYLHPARTVTLACPYPLDADGGCSHHHDDVCQNPARTVTAEEAHRG